MNMTANDSSNDRPVLKSLQRIRVWLKALGDNRWARWMSRLFFAAFFMGVGGFSYYVYTSQTTLMAAESLLYFLGLVAGGAGALLILIERVYRLELLELQVENASKPKAEMNSEKLAHDIADGVRLFLREDLPAPDSIYGAREQHYRKEKLRLGVTFLDTLKERIRYLRDRNIPEPITVILDSGTTIAPIFDKLGREASQSESHWSNEIHFVTNNLRGVQMLLKYRSDFRTARRLAREGGILHSNIPVNCSVLPGKVLAAYQAIADRYTLQALRVLGKTTGYIICVTTGNYLMSDKGERAVLPIARTRYHPDVKAAMYQVANEVFLLAPLGKVLRAAPKEGLEGLLRRFNKDLGFKSNTSDPDQEAYVLVGPEVLEEKERKKEANTHLDWMKKTILATTSRPASDYLLFSHAKYVHFSFSDFTAETAFPLDGPYVWTAKFGNLSRDLDEQLIEEVPHENLRIRAGQYFNLRK